MPALIRSLKREKVMYNAVGALKNIGPDAKEALPALKELLSKASILDSPAIQAAIDAIENKPKK